MKIFYFCAFLLIQNFQRKIHVIRSYHFLSKNKKIYDKNAFFSFLLEFIPPEQSLLDTIVMLHENVDKVTTTELPILFTKSFHDPPSSLFCPFLNFFFFMLHPNINIHVKKKVIIKTSNLMTMLFLITLHYDDIIISLCSNKDKYTPCTQL